MKEPKIFILDTCVILSDHNAYKSFEEHDVVLPICVLEELDNFKKGHDAINFEAREFIRILDKLATQPLNEWVPIGEPNTGNITVSFEQHNASIDTEDVFQEKKADHRILNVALYYKEKYSTRDVILVSKDVNLRVKAKSFGIIAEDYLTGTVKNINSLYTGKYTLTGVDEELIEKLYKEKHIAIEKFISFTGYPEDVINNAYFIIKNGKKSALGFYNVDDKHIHIIEKQTVSGISPRNAEQIFAIHAILNDKAKIVSINGSAGTGKTLLAMASGIYQQKKFDQIFIARPIVPLNNKEIGFLPGGIDEKVSPFMEPLYDALGFIKTQNAKKTKEVKKIDDMVENDKITVAALAFIRGRSLHNTLFIVDEAQNLMPKEILTIASRMGENSKIIFTGDIHQIDTPFLDESSNGLSFLIDRLKGEEMYAHITLEKGERSALATLCALKLQF